MEKEYDFSGGVRGPPRWARAVLKGRAELRPRYGRVACVHVDGWAFLMSRDMSLRVLAEHRTVAKMLAVSDISINPTGEVVKHRWELP